MHPLNSGHHLARSAEELTTRHKFVRSYPIILLGQLGLTSLYKHIARLSIVRALASCASPALGKPPPAPPILDNKE
jgi:hypothetical protein